MVSAGQSGLPHELEIGLLSNSSPVKDLVKLNDLGKIEVNRDQSTSIPGFYAAGDVTDETGKQIVIAAGAPGPRPPLPLMPGSWTGSF
jgi:alkyl hydroperoxide reductase subunit AhpF